MSNQENSLDEIVLNSEGNGTPTKPIMDIPPLESPPTRAKRILSWTAWISLGVFCLCLFTFLKLPTDRLKAYVDGTVAAALAEKGITYTTQETHLSLLFGVTYRLKGVSLYLPQPAPKVNLQEVEISPALLPMIIGKYKADIRITDPNGNLTATVATKKTHFSINFKANAVDLGKFGVLPIAAGVQGSAIIDGQGVLSTDQTDLTTTNGDIQLSMKKFILDSQSISGFPVPKIAISEGSTDVQIQDGKVQIKTLKLGKPGNTAGNTPNNTEDDLQANVTGLVTLGKHWMASKIDLNTRFSLSQAVLKPLILLDALLGSGKQSDGSYAFHLTGPILSPTPSPLEAGKSK